MDRLRFRPADNNGKNTVPMAQKHNRRVMLFAEAHPEYIHFKHGDLLFAYFISDAGPEEYI